MTQIDRTECVTKYNLKALMLVVTLLCLTFGAGVAFDWHPLASILFAAGALVIGQASIQRFPHWQAANFAGGLICLMAIAAWLWSPDSIGNLRRSRKNLERIEQDLIDSTQQSKRP